MKNTGKIILLALAAAGIMGAGCTVYVTDEPYAYSYTDRYYTSYNTVNTVPAAVTPVPTAQSVVNTVNVTNVTNVTNINVEIEIRQEGNNTAFYRGKD
ncbi:MAG TPA: hypothetical protein PKJ42_08945, partial [Candidatus Goldiibacteriota bacterium]|nr:hypothetical protein [Candidatus Goldiibacteriota bacterium]